jgi:hypothetical protein
MVFVTGGRIYSIDQNKTLDWEDMNGGGFYSWPVAHNVRPAQQSLGINGCDDCHSLNSNFYFGEVSAVSSFPRSDMKISMVSFQGLNKYYESIFSLSFYFRPALKLLLIISLLVISIIFASYLLSGVKSAAEYFSNHGQDQK